MHTDNKPTRSPCAVKNSSPKVFMSNFQFLIVIEAGKDI